MPQHSFATKSADLLASQFLRHAGIEHDVHELAAAEAEALEMSVVGEDHLRSRERAGPEM
ncbi:hypothetical protein WDZ92_51825 [Nostoc sp. NIES-2111]